ncbi:hypothetical protein N7466_008557 [Penicillium verhagenii]|uniref:uncharacterized protein n=1 Tax=Penicillium verhagenii TaxID=1562060 RepID=UPI002544FFF5|nr:uncharacterized protein N7466_008557 [Penicillium verhagenii]KAJ5924370.1 hypothetical protein N7466_008557 [Penicillium verhagenii]
MLHRTKEHLSNFSFFKLLRKDASSQPRISKSTSEEHNSESVLSSDTWVDAFEDQPFKEFPTYFDNPPNFHPPVEVDAAENQREEGYQRYPNNPPPLQQPVKVVAAENQREKGFERYPNNPPPLQLPVEEYLANMDFDEHLDSDSDFPSVSSAKHQSSPYSLNGGEWVTNLRSTSISPPSSYGKPQEPQAPKVMRLALNDMTEEQIASHFPRVLKIFCRIYAVAKLMQVAFLGYGIELDSSETGLLYWIHQAETNVRADSLFELLPIVEHLFYALYARVQFEMSCVELCWLFRFAARPGNRRFYMPVPHHMYRLFHFFREILSDPEICGGHDNGIICHFMERYVSLVIEKENSKGPFVADDILGYRQFAYSLTRNQGSKYCRKWDSLIPIFPDFPAEILVVLSEKYLTVTPKRVPEVDIRSECLPFANLELMDPVKREREIILDNHLATVAKLEGKCIGDCRREDQDCNLLHKIKQFKCICRSRCSCARLCTHNVENPCPCAERQLRMQLAINRNGTGRYDFATRVSTIAMAGFQGLAVMRTNVHDDLVVAEIAGILGVIKTEIQKQRAADMNSRPGVNDQWAF